MSLRHESLSSFDTGMVSREELRMQSNHNPSLVPEQDIKTLIFEPKSKILELIKEKKAKGLKK